MGFITPRIITPRGWHLGRRKFPLKTPSFVSPGDVGAAWPSTAQRDLGGKTGQKVDVHSTKVKQQIFICIYSMCMYVSMKKCTHEYMSKIKKTWLNVRHHKYHPFAKPSIANDIIWCIPTEPPDTSVSGFGDCGSGSGVGSEVDSA